MNVKDQMYWLTGILGLLLIIAPFVMRFSDNSTALWTSIVLGAAVFVVSAIKAAVHDMANWEYWLAGIFGLAAIVAPFVLNFNSSSRALWSNIVLGVIVAILAGYEVFFVHPQTSQ
jgi:hypothetical protein